MNKNCLMTLLFLGVVISLSSLLFSGCGRDPEGPALTPEEQRWLKELAGPIRIAPDPNDPPVEFFDETGAYRGISADYIKKFEARFGITFEVVRAADFAAVMKMAEAREIDIVTAISESEERKRILAFTEPYIDDPTVIIVRKETPGYLTTDNLGSLSLTYVKTYALHEELTTKYAHLKLLPIDDERTGLRNVSFGAADAMLIDLPSASYYIEKDGLVNLRVAGDEKIYTRYSFAVRNDRPMLASIIRKGLAGISQKERAEIRGRWIKLDYPSYWRSAEFLATAAASLAALLLLAAASVRYVRRLRKKLDERDRALLAEQTRLKDLEERCARARMLLTDVPQFTAQVEPPEERTKYESTRLSDDTLNVYLKMLMKYMEEKKPYLNQNLSLKVLADELSMYSHHLSQLLSICLDKNFNNFINEYRVEEVKQLFADPDYDKDPILSIAFQSGFNSKATFNAIFKKATGMTPSRYREMVLENRPK